MWDPKLFIDNAVAEPKLTMSRVVEKEANGDAYVVERRRLKGLYVEQLELWEFPFDVQVGHVILMTISPVFIRNRDVFPGALKRITIGANTTYLIDYNISYHTVCLQLFCVKNIINIQIRWKLQFHVVCLITWR